MLGDTLSEARFDSLVNQAASSRHWQRLDPLDVRTHYNEIGFLVEHRLAEHPLFSFDALQRLCRRMPLNAVKYRFGVIPIDSHFDTSIERYQQGLTREDAIDRLEETRAYIALYNPESDAEYKPVIEGLLGELGLALRSRERSFNWYSTYVFISAHDAVTPYHMDREMNFLLQVRGTKTVQLWDPRDDSVMQPAQRDALFSFSQDFRPPYDASLAEKARIFDLRPGLGVHHPFIAPHLVTTGPNLSISLAITFRTPRSDVWSDAHSFNHRFRPLGLGGIDVGRHASIDALKAGAFRAMRSVKSAVAGHLPFSHRSEHG
jgi:hypothetical protein